MGFMRRRIRRGGVVSEPAEGGVICRLRDVDVPLAEPMGLAYATGSALDWWESAGGYFCLCDDDDLGVGFVDSGGASGDAVVGDDAGGGVGGGIFDEFIHGGADDAVAVSAGRRKTPAEPGADSALGVLGRVAVGVGLLGLTVLLAVPPVVEVILRREKPVGVAGAMRVHPAIESPRAGVYTAGDSWMRWRDGGRQNGLWEMLLAGDAEDRGHATAGLSGPIDLRIENEMLEQLDYFLPQEWSRWLVLRGGGEPGGPAELCAAGVSAGDLLGVGVSRGST